MKNIVKYITGILLSLGGFSAQGQSYFINTIVDSNDVRFKDAAKLKNGKIIIAADYYRNGPSASSNLFIKLNTDGEIIWQSSLGTGGDDHVNKVIASVDTGFVAVGTMDTDGFAVKYSPANNIVWQTRFTFFPGSPCVINDVAEETDRSYRLLGNAYSNSIGKMQAPFMNLTFNGSNIQFITANQKYVYNNDIIGFPLVGKKIAELADTSYVLAGNTDLSSTTGGIFIGIIDIPTYNFIPSSAQKSISGPITGPQLKIADLGLIPSKQRIIVAGNIADSLHVNTKGVVIKMDLSGNVWWAKEIGNLFINKILVDADSGIIIAGVIPIGNVLLKLNTSGDVVWANTYNVPSDTIFPDIKSIIRLNDYRLMVLGEYTHPSGHHNLFAAVVDTIGLSPCDSIVSQASNDFAYTLAPYYLSVNNQPIDTPGVVYSPVPYNGVESARCINTGITNTNTPTQVSVYPNPASNEITITGVTAGSTITIYNLLGMQQQVNEIVRTNATIPLHQLAAGIYIYNITKQGAAIAKGKLLIER